MPITLTPTGPTGILGPGLLLSLDSNFIGPLPTGSQFVVTIANDAEGATPFSTEAFNTAVPFGAMVVEAKPAPGTGSLLITLGLRPVDGQTVHVLATLTEPHSPSPTVVDSGSTTAIWSNTAGLSRLILDQSTVAVNDAQTTKLNTLLADFTALNTVTFPSLNDLINSVITGITSTVTTASGAVVRTVGDLFSGKSLDTLTLAELTAGPTCDPFDADIGLADIFGIIVRITTVPAGWPWSAPGESWSFPDLAVLQLIRGGDLLHRYGIHTLSLDVTPLPGIWQGPVLTFNLPLTPPSYHVHVDWSPGVCGQVFAVTLP